MKKGFSIAVIAALVLGIALATGISTVSAYSNLAEGDWSTGTEVDLNLYGTTYPDYLQLLTNGVVVDGTTTICHQFNGAQFYWVGEIRQLVDGKWVKVATDTDWSPSTEGRIYSCATVYKAGTYALFGYYDYLSAEAAAAAETAAEE